MYIIYSKPGCSNCEKAKALLNLKVIIFKEFEIDIGQSQNDNKKYITRDELLKKAPLAKSLPQIFFENEYSSFHIGDFSDLQKHLLVRM